MTVFPYTKSPKVWRTHLSRNETNAEPKMQLWFSRTTRSTHGMLVRLAAVSCHHIRIWSIHSSIPQITQNVDTIFLLDLLDSINRAIETSPWTHFKPENIRDGKWSRDGHPIVFVERSSPSRFLLYSTLYPPPNTPSNDGWLKINICHLFPKVPR